MINRGDGFATYPMGTYTSLLNTIAKGESRGNYNAYFGNATNDGTTGIKLTSMTIDEVINWQIEYVAQGSASSAAGKYQIIRPTLEGLVKELKLDKSEIFDEAMQDKMAVTLLHRRGFTDYMNKSISREQFAENLSKEWAALPNITGSDPKASYYAGDGLNKSQISVDEIFSVLDTLGNKKNVRRI